MEICHLPHTYFDHCPILLLLDTEEVSCRTRSFRFEAWWILEETFEFEVRQLWESFDSDVLTKLNCLQLCLGTWAKVTRYRKSGLKKEWTARMCELLDQEWDDVNLVDLIDTKFQLSLEIDKDKRYWEQRARDNWLRLGDRNTSFFHNFSTQRKKQNRIGGLQSEDERLMSEEIGMERIARDYFQRLFTINGTDVTEHLLDRVATCISDESNRMLVERCIKGQVLSTLKIRSPTKAPSEDDFFAIFFQKFWHIVGKDMCSFCLEILNNGEDVSPLNHTHVVLIPKVNNPMNLYNFRLISLYNVIYKLIAKVIANQF